MHEYSIYIHTAQSVFFPTQKQISTRPGRKGREGRAYPLNLPSYLTEFCSRYPIQSCSCSESAEPFPSIIVTCVPKSNKKNVQLFQNERISVNKCFCVGQRSKLPYHAHHYSLLSRVRPMPRPSELQGSAGGSHSCLAEGNPLILARAPDLISTWC